MNDSYARKAATNLAQTDWLVGEAKNRSSSHQYNIGDALSIASCPIPQEIAFARVRDTFARHETLRTIFEPTPAGWNQNVVDMRDWDPSTSITFVPSDRDASRYGPRDVRDHDFDIYSELPCRVQIHTDADFAVAVKVAADHAATDLWGMQVLMKELHSRLSREPAQIADELSAAVLQPIDVALSERFGRNREVIARNLDSWQRIIDQVYSRSDDFVVESLEEAKHGYTTCTVESRQFHVDLSRVASRFGITRPAAGLLVFILVDAVASDCDFVFVLAAAANRYRIEERGAVGKMSLNAPVLMEVNASTEILPFAKRVLKEHLLSLSIARVDRQDREKIVADRVLRTAPDILDRYYNYAALATLPDRYVTNRHSPKKLMHDIEPECAVSISDIGHILEVGVGEGLHSDRLYVQVANRLGGRDKGNLVLDLMVAGAEILASVDRQTTVGKMLSLIRSRFESRC